MKLTRPKRLKIALFTLMGFILAIIIYGLVQLIEPVALASISPSKQPVTFNGKTLLIASDADMVATAYADAKQNSIVQVILDAKLITKSY